MLTRSGLVQYVGKFGLDVEIWQAEAIRDDVALSEEAQLQSLRQLVVQVSERIVEDLIEALEQEGFYVSIEEGGYTQILFNKGRITCVNGESIYQALGSLVHDYQKLLSAKALEAALYFRESRDWVVPEDEPRNYSRFHARRSVIDLLLGS